MRDLTKMGKEADNRWPFITQIQPLYGAGMGEEDSVEKNRKTP